MGAALGQPAAYSGPFAAVQLAPDATGIIGTFDTNGRVDQSGAFFQSLGTNGRTCATCHVASQAMSISAADVQARFERTHGQDPLFAAVDGANCPTGRQGGPAAHSLLLKSGLIRIFLPVPATAQYTITVIHDPYGCAMTPDPNGGQPVVSVYRRPLPTANLSLLSTIMFDGRETVSPLNSAPAFPANLMTDLAHQAIDAVNIHTQAAAPPSDAQVTDIVDFELGLFSAQFLDYRAGDLAAYGAAGGPVNLAAEAKTYYPGINDSLGADPSGAAFNPASMTMFAPWVDVGDQGRDAARRSIAAGEALFNSAPVHISNVRGLNDNAALNKPTAFVGTCTTCHDTPNTGNHSFPLPLDIGTGHTLLPSLETDPNIAAGLAELSMPDLPVYLVSGCPNPFNAGQVVSFYTSDPGKALVSGLCSDFNRGKGPILRGLAARAPYFHNGAAADLHELVNFYNQRFQMALTDAQKQDLIAFLNSL
jgi:cytochrome c peroxidase